MTTSLDAATSVSFDKDVPCRASGADERFVAVDHLIGRRRVFGAKEGT